MYFLGWMSLGGQEVWNVERTTTYLHANVPTLDITGCESCGTLAAALGDEPYKNNPVDDNAPWISVDEPDLADFYGFYPMSMNGLYDNTLTATVTELAGDGGFIGRPRRTSKEIRVTGVLLARTQIALVKGRAWLINTLTQSSACGSGFNCNGADMCFFATCPATFEEGDFYLRTVRDVAVSEGPLITALHGRLPSGAWMDEIEFTLTAATPFIYGPWGNVGSTQGTTGSTTGVVTLDPTAPVLADCAYMPTAPIYDPNLPPLATPPRPPTILGNYQPPTPYSMGYSLFIPASAVPESVDAVLRIRLTTGIEPVRWVRMRLYVSPMGFDQKVYDLDHCSFCGDIVVTYIPAQSVFRIDGQNQTLTIEDATGEIHQAAHLAFSSRGSPSVWATLSCGVDYWLSVEFPGGSGGGGGGNSNLFYDSFTGIDSSTFESNLGRWTNGPDTGTPPATLTWSNLQAHGGSRSMKVEWAAGSIDRPQVVINNLVPGHTYALGAWVYSPSTRVRVELGQLGGMQSALVAGWQYLQTTVTAVAESHMARVVNTTTNTSGPVWFDDFSLLDITPSGNTFLKVDLDTTRRE